MPVPVVGGRDVCDLSTPEPEVCTTSWTSGSDSELEELELEELEELELEELELELELELEEELDEELELELDEELELELVAELTMMHEVRR